MYKLYFDKDKEIRDKYGIRSVLLMRSGKFFEIYGIREGKNEYSEEITNKEIGVGRILDYNNLKISTKSKSTYMKKPICMAGIPIQNLEGFIEEYTDLDFTVAVIHQDDSPEDKKVKLRTRLEVHSPDTSTPTVLLSNKPKDTNHYLTCISCYPKKRISSKNANVSIFCVNTMTGEIKGTTLNISNPIDIHSWNNLPEILSKYPSKNYLLYLPQNCPALQLPVFKKSKFKLFPVTNNGFTIPACNRFFSEVFKVKTLPYPDSQIMTTPYHCLYKLLDYVKQQNSSLLKHLTLPTSIDIDKSVSLINMPLIQLCITQSSMFQDLAGTQISKLRSVFNLINHTKTMMGRRLLHKRITNPIYDIDELNSRFSRISLFSEHYGEIQSMLTGIPDMLILHNAFHQKCEIEPDYVYRYRTYIRKIFKVNDFVKRHITNTWIDHTKIKKLCETILESLTIFKFYDDKCIVELNDNIDRDYDATKKLMLSFKDNINAICSHLSKQIKDTKSIHKTSKVSFNSNYSCFELTQNRYKRFIKPFLDKCNTEYVLPDNTKINLNNYEEVKSNKKSAVCIKFNNSNLFKINSSSYEEVLEDIINKYIKTFIKNLLSIPELKYIYEFIGEVDVYCSLCKVMEDYDYCIPTIDTDKNQSFFSSKKMRHPIIERLDNGITYVPNDISFDEKASNMLLYGVNESGKSSLMKSCGINLIMAQAGLPVACSQFTFYPYKKIATRILARDNIWAGDSTFKVEVSELQRIINNSSDSMFVLADELCSGTEIKSAQMIVKTSIDYLNKNGTHFLFTTHLHEIKKYDSIVNNVRICDIPIIKQEDGSLLYPHILKRSAADTLYGIMVATQLPFDPLFINMLESNQKSYITNENNKQTCSYNKKTTMFKCACCGKYSNYLETDHIVEQRTSINNKVYNEYGIKQNMNDTNNLAHVCRDCHLSKTKGEKSWKFVNTSKGRKLEVTKYNKPIDLKDFEYSPSTV
jgi:DNA mismatch repair protein MutS